MKSTSLGAISGGLAWSFCEEFGELFRRETVQLCMDDHQSTPRFSNVWETVKNHLSDLLGLRVDLVMTEALKPNIGRRVLAEVESL